MTPKLIGKTNHTSTFPSESMRERLAIGFLLIAASLLLLLNLGNQYLWQDEAQTALIATTVLKHGVPLGYDGKNYFSQQSGAEYGKNYIWRWHTWFPFYLLAAFFAAFGKSTFVARFPFALFGIATIILTYYAGKQLWGTRRAGFLSAAALLVTVPFFLLARQCRLYSPAMFFSLFGLYAYIGATESRKHSLLLFCISAILLFHTFYVYYASLLATVVVHSLIFRRSYVRRILKAAGLTLAVNLPWIAWLSGMKYADKYGSNLLNIPLAFGQTKHFLYLLSKYVVPWWLFLLPLLAWAINSFRRRRISTPDVKIASNTCLMLFFAFFTIAMIALSSPAPFFRYVAPLVPVCTLFIGLMLESIARLHPAIALAGLAVIGITGQLPDYLYEITHDYDGPIEGIVKYLKENAKPDDIVAVTYEDLPIKFYTNLRVVGGLTGEDLKPALNADWVIIRKYIVSKLAFENTRYFEQNIPWEKYERIPLLGYPDIEFENREGPEEHLFRTAENEQPVIIYHKLFD